MGKHSQRSESHLNTVIIIFLATLLQQWNFSARHADGGEVERAGGRGLASQAGERNDRARRNLEHQTLAPIEFQHVKKKRKGPISGQFWLLVWKSSHFFFLLLNTEVDF